MGTWGFVQIWKRKVGPISRTGARPSRNPLVPPFPRSRVQIWKIFVPKFALMITNASFGTQIFSRGTKCVLKFDLTTLCGTRWAMKELSARISRHSVTISVRSPISSYDIAHRSCYALFDSGLFKTFVVVRCVEWSLYEKSVELKALWH